MSRFFVLSFFVVVESLALAAPKPIPADLGKSVVAKYAELVHRSYSESLATAKELRAKIDELVAKPSAATLAAARGAWKKAKLTYAQTEAFRFYGGPIDDPEKGVEGILNSWPVDESYMDYVKGNPNAGIINDPAQFPKITPDVLVSVNQKNGEENISTGYHAIEFLLWGQDLSLKSAGSRPVEDFMPGSKNSERRGEYLKQLGALLEANLVTVTDSWKPGAAYPEQLKKEDLQESLRKIFTGIVNLSMDEMAGERMTVALEKNDQENEQNCFSDLSLDDLLANEKGIHAVYFETGLNDLVKAADPALAKRVGGTLAEALKTAGSIREPFDRIVASKKSAPQRKLVQKLIASLEKQGKDLGKAGTQFGLILNVQ